jgi:tyrosine aminotransferase
LLITFLFLFLLSGANTLVQAAIPRLLCPAKGSTDEESMKNFHTHYMDVLRTSAKLCMELSQSIPELTVIEPTGAMYVMIKIDLERLTGITDDADFAKKLLEEENLFILPGQCFNMKDFFRLVICPPPEVLKDAFSRFEVFCARHRRKVQN